MMLPINRIICGDCLEVMKDMPDNSVDSVITDPPYGLSFMGHKWDYEIPKADVFKEMLRVAKPGATLLCFGGTRTFHRIACNIEDAGWILKDTIMYVFGSGFPKATDISKNLDKKAGAEREVVGESNRHGGGIKGNGTSYEINPEIPNITAPSTPEAQLWDGWKSHGLKPAFEPIIVAMKPNEGSYSDNALKHGVSGLWIEGGMVGTDEITHNQNHKSFQRWKEQDGREKKDVLNPSPTKHSGRFPSNFIHDGSDEVMRLFPNTKGSVAPLKNHGKGNTCFGDYGSIETQNNAWGDSGSAARYFYCAKPSKAERNAGLGEFPEIEGGSYQFRQDGSLDGKIPVKKNDHSTVKPLSLMRYLCRITKTPTGGIVLDPYLGSGSTACAAVLEGREYIGIEQDEHNSEISRARIAHWSKIAIEERLSQQVLDFNEGKP